jgi:hypothetical protein
MQSKLYGVLSTAGDNYQAGELSLYRTRTATGAKQTLPHCRLLCSRALRDT